MPSPAAVLFLSPVPENPQVDPVSMFEPPEEIDPAPPQFPPDVLLATIVLVMVTSAGDQMPPPRFAELNAIVTFFSVVD